MADINIKAGISIETGDANAGLKDVQTQLEKTGKAVKDVDGNAKGAGGSFSKLRESLTSVSPAAKTASEGAGMFNDALNLLKANPIVAVIGVLVAIVVALFSKFKQMESVSDSLGKAFGVLSGIFNTFINRILTPLIDGFVFLVDLFTNSVVKVLDVLGVTSEKTGQRLGAITEALDDLQDAEKDAAISIAESNRKLQEAREIASDANVPIRDRIKALKEAGKIEKEELDKVVKMNQLKAQLTMESIAMELGARDGLIAKIRQGSLESLKAARTELAALKNVDKDKLYAIDAMIIAAENAGAQSAKIGKKTQTAITSLEKEEEGKRDAIRKEAAAKAKDLKQKAFEEEIKAQQEQNERLKKLLTDGEKAVQDALKVLRVENRQTELNELNKKYKDDLAAAEAAGFGTLRIREAHQKQQDDVNAKYNAIDAEAKTKAQLIEDKAREDRQLSAINNLTFSLEKSLQLEREAAAAKIEIDAALLEHQKAIQAEAADLLGKASEVFGKETAVGKGLAIAQALINTYSGATDALRAKSTLPSPFDVVAKVVNVGAVLATGFKAIKAITAVRVPGAAGGGGVPSLSVSAPVLPQQTSTSLNASSIQAVGNAASGGVNRNFVLDADINNAADRAARLNRAARLG